MEFLKATAKTLRAQRAAKKLELSGGKKVISGMYRRSEATMLREFALLTVLFGVGTAVPQSFEVASIKPSAADARMVKINMLPGGRYMASGVNAKMLIMQAYDVRDYQISGGPGWLASDRYDVNAKAETPNLDRETMKVLLQSLLAERFKLQVHRETKELPIYALVVGKGEPRLRKSEDQPELKNSDTPPKAPPAGQPTTLDRAVVQGPGGSIPKSAMMFRMGRGQLSAQRSTLAALAMQLASTLGRPVVDKTGLTGYYDFDLQWTPDETQGGVGMFGEKMPADSAPAGESTGPSIFTALQEQLGLKLESQKGPVEILVIERIEKPTEN